MITHNMRDAILHGNRLIMMWEGRVVLDIRGEEKKHLTVNDLLQQFEKASGEQFANDQALLGIGKVRTTKDIRLPKYIVLIYLRKSDVLFEYT